MAEVKLVRISKTYGKGERVIQDISIEVKDQEFLVLVGPSGCGKSTLLRLIAGLEDITEGELFLDGKKINQVAPRDRDVAMVFQNYALYPHMTVYENMAFGLKLRRFPAEDIRRSVLQAARILEIENLLNRKPKEMSGGQRQRVAIGRAIVRNPKVFLFDEPLSNLDAKLRGQMRIELQKLHRELKATMIYVTHDQVEAMTLGDRIAVLRSGIVMQHDTPINLYTHPANQFVAGFIGSPPMNFLKGRLTDALVFESGGLRLDLNARNDKPMLVPYRDKEVIVGIRPEQLSAADGPALFQYRVAVDAVEQMGSETVVHFPLEDSRFIARLAPDVRPAVDGQLDIFWDLNRCHFFDARTGQTICNGVGEENGR